MVDVIHLCLNTIFLPWNIPCWIHPTIGLKHLFLYSIFGLKNTMIKASCPLVLPYGENDQRPVFSSHNQLGSRDPSRPIRGQYPGHVITLDQSEASLQVKSSCGHSPTQRHTEWATRRTAWPWWGRWPGWGRRWCTCRTAWTPSCRWRLKYRQFQFE